MLQKLQLRHLLAIAIVLAGLSLAALIAVNLSRRGGEAEKPRPLPGNIEVALEKVRFTETAEGRKKWDLMADSAAYDRSGENVSLSGVRLEVPAGGRIGLIVLTAQRADYSTRTRDVTLSGNVNASSASGMTFSTGKVSMVTARSLISTTDRVRYRDAGMTVEGEGMELSTASRNLRVFRAVSATIDPTGLSR